MAMLNKEQIRKIFTYQDGNLYWINKRNGIRSNRKAGWVDEAYKRCEINGKSYYLHKLIFLYHHGYVPEVVDHIDGDPLNNEITNLRACTQLENMNNYKRPITNTSGLKNLYWVKKQSKWMAKATAFGKSCYLGMFESKFEAACAIHSFIKNNKKGFDCFR